MTLATAGWMASMTKVMTSVAVMQIVERGFKGLDDDLAEVIPELRAEMFVGLDEPTAMPVLKKSHSQITLRYSLTEHHRHWGFVIDFCHQVSIGTHEQSLI